MGTVLAVLAALLLSLYLAITISPNPENSFWVERDDAVMPVWVRGNIESGVFVIFNHGGPGSSGTLESIIEANPGDGQLGQESPLKALEEDYAVVYWDQRHSGLSKGDVDPNESQPDDFGLDLAAVVEALDDRYAPDRVFVVGQSWGHFVAMNYLTSLESWQSNQARIDGYIGYKGNHEQGMAYEAARNALMIHSESQIEDGYDVDYWQGAIDFYQARPTLSEVEDYWTHYEYLDHAMGASISLPSRIWSSVRASFFSPFNGFTYYSNNRATNQAEDFMELVVTDRSIRTTIDRLTVPTLLVYGRHDLIAPVEDGFSDLDRSDQVMAPV
ncbi:MAG: alpha/beta hydrolase, partial [Actinomycetota bacterium]